MIRATSWLKLLLMINQPIPLNFSKLLYGCFYILLLTLNSCVAQNTKSAKPPMTMNEQQKYPLIEIYYEIELTNDVASDKNDALGNPINSTILGTDPSGNTVYGGKRSYNPHIIRETHVLNNAQKKNILQSPLHRHVYFDSETRNTTLGDYFDALKSDDKSDLKDLLPENLDLFNSRKLTDKGFQHYSTLLAYEKSFPQSITVIWLDENTYFVNDMYFDVSLDLNEIKSKNTTTPVAPKTGQRSVNELSENEKIVGAVNFATFLQVSPIFQNKISEGLPSLKLITVNPVLPLDEVVLGVNLSAGMPNTTSYSYEICGDGSYLKNGKKSKEKINLSLLNELLVKAQAIDWQKESVNSEIKKLESDRQVLTISAWKNGILHRLIDPDTSNSASDLSEFTNLLQGILVKK